VAKTQRRILWTALGMLATALALLLAGVRWVTLLVSRPLAALDRSTRSLTDRDAGGITSLSPGGTAEVRGIAARFLDLLNQLNTLERLLPPPQRKAVRERRDHVVAGIVSPAAADSEEAEDGIWSETYLEQRSAWLVFHRWIAIGGIFIAWLIYLSLGLRHVSAMSVLACMIAMCAWNGFLQLRGRWPSILPRRPLRFWLMAQIVSDLVALTVLLHLFGGMENPFKLFYVFLMVIAGLTFHIRISVRLAVFGSVIYAAMIFGEMASYLPHYPLFPTISSGVWSQPYLVLGEAVGMTIVQLGVVFFVHSVTARRQEAETVAKAAEKIALSRERMAMLGEMAAGVAHEIRNPIHGLLNCCSLLRDKTRSVDESDELLNLLEEGLRRVSSISDRLLRLSQAGDLRRGDVDLSTVVSSTADLVRETARKKGITIDIRSEESIPSLEGDSDRLAEAVLNLLNNSLDACEFGDTITLSLQREKDPWDVVRLVVRDTGDGIPAEVLPRIFDVFFTTKAVGQGSGLGLALVQETVRMHGGTVSVQSAPGKGTEVTILLPVKESE
jgi:signal transduction histidine kinase